MKKASQPTMVSVHALIHKEVKNAQGEHLGQIEELLIDLSDGRAAYAVLSHNILGPTGERLLAIPWQVLRFEPGGSHLVLNISKERLQNAPGFSKSHWPQPTDCLWLADADGYYGCTPYYG